MSEAIEGAASAYWLGRREGAADVAQLAAVLLRNVKNKRIDVEAAIELLTLKAAHCGGSR